MPLTAAQQWLHAAQAPVRPRHCTQALLQKPDQLILCRALRHEHRSVSASGDSINLHRALRLSLPRFRAPASAVGVGGVDMSEPPYRSRHEDTTGGKTTTFAIIIGVWSP